MVALTSSTFWRRLSLCVTRVGNLPALLRPGPSKRGICLMRLSDAKKASYLLAERERRQEQKSPLTHTTLKITIKLFFPNPGVCVSTVKAIRSKFFVLNFFHAQFPRQNNFAVIPNHGIWVLIWDRQRKTKLPFVAEQMHIASSKPTILQAKAISTSK